MTTEIQLHTSTAIALRSIDEARALAKDAADSKLFAVKTQAEALVILLTGQELGLPPMASLRGVYVVNGKPSLSADLMVALIERSGLCELWRTVETTPAKCTIEVRRKGGETTSRTWTMEDAKRADLANKPLFRQYPAQMLRHRCAADIARELFPDVILGLYTPDEIRYADGAKGADVEVTEQVPNEPAASAIDLFRAAVDHLPALAVAELVAAYHGQGPALQVAESLGDAKHTVATTLRAWGVEVTNGDVQTLLAAPRSEATEQTLALLTMAMEHALVDGNLQGAPDAPALVAWYRQHAPDFAALEQTREVTAVKAIIARTWCKRAGVETKTPNKAFTAALSEKPDPDGPKGTPVTPPADAPANTNGTPVETAEMGNDVSLAAAPEWARSAAEIAAYAATKRHPIAIENAARKWGRKVPALLPHLAARLEAVTPADHDGTRLTPEGATTLTARWAKDGPVQHQKAA